MAAAASLLDPDPRALPFVAVKIIIQVAITSAAQSTENVHG
jgi:hypothetical protein